MSNRDGRFERLNTAWTELLGYDVDEMVGRPVQDFVHPEDREEFASQMQRLRSGETAHLECRLVTKSGDTRTVAWARRYVPDRRLVFGVVRDITDRLETDEQLRAQAQELMRSNAELEQLAYVVSHDLQEPLRTITNYVELLERRMGDGVDAESTRLMSRVVDGAERMQHLIQDLLAYARAGGSDREDVDVDCNEVLGWVLDDLASVIEARDVRVVAGDLPTVRGDAVALTAVFENLIGNAIKFSPERPVVTVDAVREPDCWRFGVGDNGVGIDPKFAERIFEPFKRLHTRDEYPGTGIGLAVCRKIVERHGGSIAVVPSDAGARFEFTLPVQPKRQRRTSAPKSSSTASS
jgi:PAS domain S-box-containing protein